MAWLRHVDAWIACKKGAIYRKLKNGKTFFFKGKQFLSNVHMLSHLQMKQSMRKNHNFFWMNVNELMMK